VKLGRSGVHCLTVQPNSEGNPLGLVDAPPADNVRFERIDVPVMRTPRRSLGISLALRTYIELWFRIQQVRMPMDMENATYAAIIVTAALTGLSHPAPPPPGNCGYVQPRPGTNLFRPKELGLRKTGQQSHRINPVPIAH
jgi:hypothetical protein